MLSLDNKAAIIAVVNKLINFKFMIVEFKILNKVLHIDAILRNKLISLDIDLETLTKKYTLLNILEYISDNEYFISKKEIEYDELLNVFYVMMPLLINIINTNDIIKGINKTYDRMRYA